MTCKKALRKMQRMTIHELQALTAKSVAEHLAVCSHCRQEREAMLAIIADLRLGARFSPPKGMWSSFKVTPAVAKAEVFQRPRLLRQLDWLLAPMINVKSAAFSGVALLLAIVLLSGPTRTTADPEGLPNSLVVVRGPIHLHESLNAGISIKEETYTFHPAWSDVEAGNDRSDAR